MAFIIKRGDTRPTYLVQLREFVGTPDERPIDLSAAQSVALVVKPETAPDLDAPKFKGVADIVNDATRSVTIDGVDYTLTPDNGFVEYTWADTDTDAADTYSVEAEITWAPGEIETVPNDGYWSLIVKEDLG